MLERLAAHIHARPAVAFRLHIGDDERRRHELRRESVLEGLRQQHTIDVHDAIVRKAAS